MNQVFAGKEDCTGCTACAHSCPVQAIAMEPDKEGFLYPAIDSSLCTECGLCRQACPLLIEGNTKGRPFSQAFAAKHLSSEVLQTCTSGGAFTALSDGILRQGGAVYGADFGEDFQVLHRRADTPEQRDRFKGSKYVQSNLHHIFLNVLSDLTAGRQVLFTGTPCQTAGLRSFTAQAPEKEGLFLCDLICYGIPSPLIWQAYLQYLAAKNDDAITSASFRSKRFAWSRGGSGKNFLYTTRSHPEPQTDNGYYALFFSAQTIMRPSCYRCRFADARRPSDITIADYWGIEKYDPTFMDPKGVSLVLTNTAKGEELWDTVKDQMDWQKRPAHESMTEQKRLRHPAELPGNRAEFWQDFLHSGFAYVLKKYGEKHS